MKIQKKKRKSASKIVTPAHVDTVEGKFIFKKKKGMGEPSTNTETNVT